MNIMDYYGCKEARKYLWYIVKNQKTILSVS